MRRSPYGFDVFDTCSSCAWRTDQFFCAMDPASLEILERITFTNVYPAGSLLFAEGEPPRAVYVLCKGTAKLSAASDDGKTLITHIAHAGEALGLSSVISGHDHKTTAETLEPCQLKLVRRDDFLRFMAEHIDAALHTCHQLSDECENANDHIRAIGLSHSAAEKLAHLILSWCVETGRVSDAGTRVQVLMTHHDISQLIGTSRETVTRLLKEFREKKILSVRGSTLIVHNRAALEALVSM